MSKIEDITRPQWRFVADEAELRERAAPLLGLGLVSVDTETYWDRAAGGGARVSLVQVAAPEGEVLVADVLTTGVEPLRELVESPSVQMVAHNARFDEGVLRGAGLDPRGFLDTLQMARMTLRLRSYSLAAVTEHLFGLPLDKTLRTSNWRRRPLTRAQIEYAAKDARVTLKVFEELSRRLAEEGRLEMALRLSEIRPPSGERKPRKKRGVTTPAIALTPEEKRVVTRLKKWRLERAFQQRVPAYMICPDRTLEHL
ncbi:MAG TPA: HRDC domain-containing protein, partial [Pyrinomonadaceae bacterium]|nr:HRDC domain-containing protein [Pyrinomonadaceae bacterium]